MSKDIVTLKGVWAEIMSVWIETGYHQKYGHSHKQECTEPVIIFFVFKEKVKEGIINNHRYDFYIKTLEEITSGRKYK